MASYAFVGRLPPNFKSLSRSRHPGRPLLLFRRATMPPPFALGPPTRRGRASGRRDRLSLLYGFEWRPWIVRGDRSRGDAYRVSARDRAGEVGGRLVSRVWR